MDIRQLINEMAQSLEWVNKTFSYKDIEANKEHFARFKDIIATLQTIGVKVNVAETWERGLVCVEVVIDEVTF